MACLTVLAVTIDPPADRESRWYESLVLTVLSPFQRVVTFVGNSVKNVAGGYVYLVGVASENEELRSLNSSLSYKTLLMEELAAENERLRRLLGMREQFSWKVVGADVIAYNPRAEFRILTINRGSRDGLRIRMPVLAAEGLVGQVYRVGAGTAQVLLLTDPTSAVDARTESGAARGLVVGKVLTTHWNRAYYLTALEFVDRVSSVENGIRLVTTGLDGIFPSGIPIGSVRDVKVDPQGIFKEAQVVLLADPASIQDVIVILDGEI